ncbi:MAG: ABC-2 transporter permease [Lachnospiraceae bacterium]|nr:ABC-2 transporter permease [Lachnospiraceae bacterium]
MKGLLIKDTHLAMFNKKIYIIFAFVACIMLVSTDFGESTAASDFIIGYFCFLFGMLVLTTITYDEFDHSISFLMTMPISRHTYVLEKYVFCFLGTLSGWILAVVLATGRMLVAGLPFAAGEWISGCIGVLLAIFMIMLVLIPLQIKFGSDNGKGVIMGVMIAFFVVFGLGKKVCDWLGIDIEGNLQYLINQLAIIPAWLIVVAVAVIYLAGIGISAAVSMRIVDKKQY